MKILRWVVALIIGFFAAVFGASIYRWGSVTWNQIWNQNQQLAPEKLKTTAKHLI
jgi:hypothetical protein